MVIRKNPMHDTSTPPGQFKYPKRLGDIIEATLKYDAMMDQQIKKLTFEEWWKQANHVIRSHCPEKIAEHIWEVAKENK